MTEAELISAAVDAGATDDEIRQAVSKRRGSERTDPRQDTRSMRPNVSGPDEDPVTVEHQPYPLYVGASARYPVSLPENRAAQDEGLKRFNDIAFGQVAGALAGGAVGTAARALPGVGSALSGAAGTAARRIAGAATGAASGLAAGAASSLAAGQAPSRNTLLISTLLGMAPPVAGEVADAIRNPLHRTGRELANLEAAGGRAAVTKGIPGGDVGTGQMATAEEAKIADAVGSRQMAADERLQSELEPVAQDLGRRPIATTSAIDELDAVRGQSRGGAGPTLAPSDNHLADVQSQLRGADSTADLAYAQPPEGVWSRNRMQALLGQGPGAEVNTFGELRALHKAENEIAAKAMTDPTLPGGAAQQAAGAVRKVIRGNEIPGGGHTTDPRVAPALDAYANEQDALRSIDDKLYSSDEAIPPTREAKKVAGARKLASAGTESKAQQPVEAQLDELAALDPGAAAAVRRMRGRNAAEATRFGLPQPSGSVANTVARGFRQNEDAALTRIVEPSARALGGVRASVSPLMLFLLGQTNEQETTDGHR